MTWLQQSKTEAHFMRFPGTLLSRHFLNSNFHSCTICFVHLQTGQLPLVKIMSLFQHFGGILKDYDFNAFTGSLINKYLECSAELEDHAIHLLFSANRWELL